MDIGTVAALAIGAVNTALLAVLLAKQGSGRHAAEGRKLDAVLKQQELLDKLLRDEFARSRQEQQLSGGQQREELAGALNRQHHAVVSQLTELMRLNESKLEALRESVERKLSALQADNNAKLEQMRATVDEKLHATLEQRLGDSFKLVGERLELVHKGLGEMQALASGVGDLKKVLSNVKTRGTLGEIQLEALLEQSLSPEQFERNVAIRRNASERVDFVVKLPDKSDGKQSVLLPIDAKFPLEDYQRLTEAQENGDAAQALEAMKLLEARVKAEAKSIRDKYIDPPNTTEFAILFLPVEGLFAEVLRRPGLWETLQRDYRVVVTGPTTLSALLNSLQMGFRTLAIQKRSGEVWQVLGAVKTEFGKFGALLDKTQKKLQEASNTLDSAATRTRAIERKLRGVEELPAAMDEPSVLPELDRAAND
ncbi:DNA recombination protein RmuC [Paenibacillus thermotolerans]|uniref:DNA recombination protein RmuC n=1 Tax=Paenibacillus thermotolerans TaxID=3027807 RepID=UPI002368F181|nr:MULTISPECIES: DNA recombination protein RmuC [unclassified Paenibacillus]